MLRKKRTKIVCTIGPKSSSPDILKKMIMSGMDAARLNFSHGNAKTHIEIIRRIRGISREIDVPVAIIQDLTGPKIRIGCFADEQALVSAGDRFILTGKQVIGDHSVVSLNYPQLYKEVAPGDPILIDDGMIMLSVQNIEGYDIICSVINGGLLKNNKGVNLPNTNLSLESLTTKDMDDLAVGIREGVDYVALSFVRSAIDVVRARDEIEKLGGTALVIAKLETPASIENVDAILEVSDGIMVARGDLGVEVRPEKVPSIQKDVIRRANSAGKLVITATQMLESMVQKPRPTRAEASDVANAVYDGSDALMLSAETSVGSYPIESVSMMKDIIIDAEHNILKTQDGFTTLKRSESGDLADAVSHAVRMAAEHIGARAIVVFSQSGYTAMSVSKYRPKATIIAFTPNTATQHRMNLYWGVAGRIMKHSDNMDELLESLCVKLLEDSFFHSGDKIVIILGLPLAKSGVTNLMHISVL